MTKVVRSLFLGAVIGTLSILAACTAITDVKSPPGTTTTVILLRHAERIMFMTNLTEEGRARAAALPAAVAGYDIAAIYSPDKIRNLDTVRPLSRQRGVEIRVIDETDAAAVMVHENPGKVVLWVGNTDNLDYIYEFLGGTGEPPIKYGDLFILSVPDKGATKVIRSRYGK